MKNHMVPKSKKPSLRWRSCARAIFLVLFLFFVFPVPRPAHAVTVEIPELDAILGADFAKNIAQMGIIGTFLNGILSIFQFLQDNVLPSGFAAITGAINAQNIITNNQIANSATYTANARDYTQEKGLITKAQLDALMPNQMQACAVLQFEQGLDQMEQGMHGLESAHASLVLAGDCNGTQANCPGPGRTQIKFIEPCKLGYISERTHGDLATTAGCVKPPDPTYIDRDKNLDAFLHTYQMPMANACILPDGYAYFANSLPPGLTCQAGTVALANYDPDPTKSQLAWVAAYKLCENLTGDPETPVYTKGRSITPQDISDVMRYRRYMAAAMSAKHICFDALWARTACPMSTANSAKAAGGTAADTCAAYQRNLCVYMTTPPNKDGADIEGLHGAPTFPTATGLGITNEPALENCLAGGGISPLMVDSIIDRLCANENWMTNIMPSVLGSTTALDKTRSLDECQKIRDAFRDQLMHEANFMEKLVSESVKLFAKNGPQNASDTIGVPRPAP